MPSHGSSLPSWRLIASVLVTSLVLLIMSGPPCDPPAKLGPVAATALEGTAEPPGPPIVGEIAEVFGERDAELDRLRRLHEAAPDFDSRLLLEREMADVKRRAVLEMFRVQRRYAQERDDARTVELMDASIRRIEHRLAKGSTLPAEDVPVREAAPAGEVKP